MDIVEFQEKMDPNHRALFCRMLKMEQLPECLLEEYVKVKLLADRIDGHLGIGTLVLIAMIAGYDPETGKFCVVEQTVDETVDDIVEQPVDKPVDKPVEQTVSGATGQAADESDGKALQEPEQQAAASGKIWSPGMPVNVLAEDELKPGTIVGVYPSEAGSGKAIQLTVEFEDGEIVTVDVDEVEAE